MHQITELIRNQLKYTNFTEANISTTHCLPLRSGIECNKYTSLMQQIEDWKFKSYWANNALFDS